MTDRTYSDKASAIRGYLRANTDCELDKDELKEHLVQTGDRWSVVIAEELEDDDSGLSVGPIRPIKGTGAYKDVMLRRRTIEAGAVSWAWSVFNAMPAGSTRKQAVAEAVRVGIAFYTARTQYQRWMRRNDVKPDA